jgi:hypothetical protein
LTWDVNFNVGFQIVKTQLKKFTLCYIDLQIVAQKPEKLTCFCPKSWQQIQHSTTTTNHMIISGPLFIILLLFAGNSWGRLAIGREDCGSEA